MNKLSCLITSITTNVDDATTYTTLAEVKAGLDEVLVDMSLAGSARNIIALMSVKTKQLFDRIYPSQNLTAVDRTRFVGGINIQERPLRH